MHTKLNEKKRRQSTDQLGCVCDQLGCWVLSLHNLHPSLGHTLTSDKQTKKRHGAIMPLQNSCVSEKIIHTDHQVQSLLTISRSFSLSLEHYG